MSLGVAAKQLNAHTFQSQKKQHDRWNANVKFLKIG
jgi:hypothetical protein